MEKKLKGAMKIFTGVGKKEQGRNWHIFVCGGGKNWNFWANYLFLLCILQKNIYNEHSHKKDLKQVRARNRLAPVGTEERKMIYEKNYYTIIYQLVLPCKALLIIIMSV